MDKFQVRHTQPQEYPAVVDLIGRVFFGDSDARYEEETRGWLVSRPRMPGFDYAAHRIGVLTRGEHEHIISHMQIDPFTLRYGSVTLRVSGVGAVCTHPGYRHRGYNSALMHDSLAYMAEQGTHLALLNGIKGFYGRFGFNSVFPDYLFEVDSAAAATLPMPLHLRPPTTHDVPYMAALYQKHWAGRVTFTRDAALWLWRVAEADRHIQVVEDGQGRVCGYIAAPHETSDLAEVVADSMDAALTLLAAAGRVFQQAGIERVAWLLPPDDALVYYARQVLPVRVSALYQPDSGWMARIIDTEALVSALLPELSAQASSTMPDFKPKALEFVCQPDVVQIGLKGKAETYSRISHQDFIQVMFGSLRPAMLALRSGMSHEALRLLEALFPPRMAALACWDWF
ncbi:MAG: GNAT family N-acetyltransferase [Anaerolineae bacterium]